MTGAGATLARVVAALECAGASHMVVGSFASTFHGEPRTTQDIDIVVRIDEDQLDRFLAALPGDEWYADALTAKDALRRRSMFNVVDYRTGWKVDVIVLDPEGFDLIEFERRIETDLLGTRVSIATAEDTIISKLRWARASRSERQLRDVAGVLAVSGEALDRDYVERWTTELGLDGLWQQVSAAG